MKRSKWHAIPFFYLLITKKLVAVRATKPFTEAKETLTFKKAKSRKALAVNCTNMTKKVNLPPHIPVLNQKKYRIKKDTSAIKGSTYNTILEKVGPEVLYGQLFSRKANVTPLP